MMETLMHLKAFSEHSLPHNQEPRADKNTQLQAGSSLWHKTMTTECLLNYRRIAKITSLRKNLNWETVYVWILCCAAKMRYLKTEWYTHGIVVRAFMNRSHSNWLSPMTPNSTFCPKSLLRGPQINNSPALIKLFQTLLSILKVLAWRSADK